MRPDFAGADAVFDVGLDPVFEALAHFGAAMNQGDASAAAEKIERRFGGGIFPADDDDVLVPVRVRVGEIMRNVWKIFAGNAERIRQIVIAGGDDDFPGAIFVAAGIASVCDDEGAVLSRRCARTRS